MMSTVKRCLAGLLAVMLLAGLLPAALAAEEPAQVDGLIQATGIPARRVSSALTMLEIDGMVRQHSGKRYTRLVTLAE